MERMAHCDQMTLLLNRAGLEQEVRFLDPNTSYAFAIVDLNNFKPINDTFGHAAGDAVLIEIAKRLACLAHDAVVARLGGDEFAVLDAGVGAQEEYKALGARLVSVFDAPIRHQDQTFNVSASIGMAYSSEFDQCFDAVMSAADATMYDLKGKGKTRVGFYTPELAVNVHNLDRKAELENAIKTFAIRPLLQPKVTITNGNLHGFEALARWDHQTRGLLPPSEFLDDIMRYNLQLNLTSAMIRQVLQQLRTWDLTGYSIVPTAVNVSPDILALDEGIDDLLFVFSEFKDVAKFLILELTEDVFIGRSYEIVRNSINKITKFGVGISIDDFGSGYASFRHLQEIPLNEVKIDQSFVGDIGKVNSAEVILKAFISIGKGLDVGVVAEGVETEKQRQFLASLGCDVGQGFLFSPALDFENAAIWLKQKPQLRRKISS